jgi:hypothetical protein
MESPDSRYIKKARKITLAMLPPPEQTAFLLHHYARVAAWPLPILSGDQ